MAFIVAIAGLAAACAAPSTGAPSAPSTGAPSAPSMAPQESAIRADFTHPPGLPVDPSLTPVSRSNPGKEASAALALCLKDGDLGKVTGVAELPANRVREFTLTNGKDPDLQSDDMVWAIQLQGLFPVFSGPYIFDPLCVVKNGASIVYAPYGRADGGKFTPPPDFVWPVVALPPLAD